MTRSERLMQLIRLLKSQRRVTLEQLSAACRVSQRTVYRDVATLAKMNVPVYYDNGYRLARTTGFPMADFGNEDLELICYCLEKNPLVENPFFSRRFRAIGRKIADKLKQRTGSNQHSLFMIDDDTAESDRSPESVRLERFLRAIVEGRKVELVGPGTHLLGMWVPLSIRARRVETFMVIARSVVDAPIEVAASEVRDVRMIDVHFDRLQADHLRRQFVQQKKELTRAEA